jgi:hypothetical protein
LRNFIGSYYFLLLGIATPLSAVFMGHYETYALSYTGLMLWIYLIGRYFKKPSFKTLLISPFVFILVLQTHITYWLLLPSLIFLWVWHYKDHKTTANLLKLFWKLTPIKKGSNNVLSWNGLLFYVFTPILVVLLYAYVFVYQNHDGPRMFSKDEFEGSLFLPLYTDEPAPYDRCNLFSISHFWDYLNLIFTWSTGLLVLLLGSVFLFFKKIKFNSPEVLITGFTGGVFMLVYFLLNPLLSPTKDWDLFCTPGIIFFPLSVFVFTSIKDRISLKMIAGPVLGCCVLLCSSWIVNREEDVLSKYLIQTGMRSYKTYWIGSSTDILGGVDLIKNEEKRLLKYDEILDALKPYSAPGNDKEYAALIRDKGKAYEAR